MNEGGQSSTGQLIDFVMTTHPAYPSLVELSKKTGKSTYELLGELLDKLQKSRGAETLSKKSRSAFAYIVAHLTKDMHFYPDLHGNRSPLADPNMTGMICGLKLDAGLDDLAQKFNVTLEVSS